MRTKLRKITSVCLAVIMILGVLTIAPFSVSAATYGDYSYTLNDDFTCVITKYNGKASNVTIPSTIYGNKVTKIGHNAFDNTSVVNVVVPNNVIELGSYCFISCKNLKSVSLSNKIKIIEWQCFSGCTALQSISIPNSVECIKSYAFENCNSLNSVVLGNGVTNIDSRAFAGCSKLSKIEIPNSVKSIGKQVFSGCTELKTVNIGSGLENIGESIFDHFNYWDKCRKLESIIVNSNNNKFSSVDGVLFDKNKSAILIYPYNKQNVSYTIPSTVNEIYSDTFCDCKNLKEVTVLDNVKKINTCAMGYIDNNDYHLEHEVISGFTIKGYKGTEAEIYARNNNFNFVELKKPVTPQITKLENTASGIKISWNKVSGAYGYRLYYKYPGKDWKRFKDTTSTSFTDTGVSAGRTETYTIRCIDSNGNTISGYNSSGWSKKYEPVAPTITKLENTASGIKISWNKVAGVYGYRLYYKYPGKDWKRFKDTTSTSFTDTGVSAGRTETYTIRCIDKNGNTVSGYYSSGWSKKYEPVAPTITKLENTSSGVKITWNKVAGVYGYRLYYKYPGQDWKRFKDTTATSFTDTGVKSGRTETYTIRCIDKNGNTISGYYPNGWSITYR